MFYEKLAIAIAACALAAALLDASRTNWTSESRESFHYTFPNDKTLDVDNIDGTIDIAGDNGSGIRVEGERILRAEDQRALDRAKQEVKLDVNEKDGIAQLYVNGPFRHGDSSGNHGFHIHFDDREYEATYNFTIHVPRETALRLETVNGEVRAQGTRGRFEVHGVNGPIAMNGIGGSGDLRTVNGRIDVSFREKPSGACDFRTVNGAIRAAFPPDLSADVHLKTLNGQAWTDFEPTALLPPASAGGFPRGRFTYNPNRGADMRIGAGRPGSGGASLSFETVNGEIQIKKETFK